MSAARAAHRAYYAAYITSPAWRARRRTWLTRHRRDHHTEPVCVVCDRAWTLDDDLHHASYDHLGHEHDSDLIPMCRVCHEALHRILDGSRAWRAMPRRMATAALVAILRARCSP